MPMQKCPKCGSENIDLGKLVSKDSWQKPLQTLSPTFAYISNKQDNLQDQLSIVLSGNVPFMKTAVCLGCGYFENYIEVDKLKK